MLPITKDGYEKITKELSFLKTVKRPQIIQAIAAAREQGDLSENAEYDSAREEQAFCEGRIQELENKVAQSNVIDPDQLKKDKVYFGSRVELLNLDSGEKIRYQIVSEDDASVTEGRISYQSPIGRALINKIKNEEFVISTPSGVKEFRINKII